MKKKKISVSEPFQNPKIKLGKIDTRLTFLAWYRHFNRKLYGSKLPISMKICGHASIFHMRFTLKLSHIIAWTERRVLNPRFLVEIMLFNSLVFCVVFCRSLFVFFFFSYGHCIICHCNSGFWLPLCYLQTLLVSVVPSSIVAVLNLSYF